MDVNDILYIFVELHLELVCIQITSLQKTQRFQRIFVLFELTKILHHLKNLGIKR